MEWISAETMFIYRAESWNECTVFDSFVVFQSGGVVLSAAEFVTKQQQP